MRTYYAFDYHRMAEKFKKSSKGIRQPTIHERSYIIEAIFSPKCDARDDAYPAKRKIDQQTQQLRNGIEENRFEGNAGCGHRPYGRDDAPSPNTGEINRMHRGNGSGNQNKNRRVIKPLQDKTPCPGFWQKMVYATHR